MRTGTEPRPSRLQHQQLLVTLYGLYGQANQGIFPVSVLVGMFGALGIDAPAVRSTVSRLKRNGVLVSSKEAGIAGYSLSADVLDAFEEGDRRIYAPERSRPEDPWSLVIFSVPEAERNRRYELRTELTSLGFGAVGAGVAIAPNNVLSQAVHRLKDRGLDGYVEYFSADYLSEQDIASKVAQWWDLEELDGQYRDFLEIYGIAEREWAARLDSCKGIIDPAGDLARDAFAYYVPMLTVWRRFPYRDPNLPLEFLPDGWKAPAAKAAFWALDAQLAPVAKAYALALLDSRGVASGTSAIQDNASGQWPAEGSMASK
ncbi:PaaX family transcriptional regulator [Paeniglutamicibacter gangotriensis]|uniref:PaaX family transcriptional regulator n=2 Tax=Paeniglutamicibacter gangotriensis TaxID=254787 RepID=M7MNJ9_9MICC|nr:PaaX family transcriptional regulator C-terminal domain-containing protein [Paeniglutamicibacter gangotriensis]EMQ97932.1 PaaX family transcriptional regulator [Paeniglutamicibacter gangotriensis Lz1y]KAA0978898.1 PaaX family transcriptional regulator [Paeniglutamicibacter gangotriensis]